MIYYVCQNIRGDQEYHGENGRVNYTNEIGIALFGLKVTSRAVVSWI